MKVRIPVLFALLVTNLCGAGSAEPKPAHQQARQAKTAQPATEKWFDVTSIGDSIASPKKEISLSAQVAAQIFTKDFPHVAAEWREKVEEKYRT